jgi:CDP-diacylglycerol--serine O-phosphatidyltransferase
MTLKRQFVPSLFTSLNFFFGFLSIIMSLQGDLSTAAWLILFAILCDGMDGKLARRINSETSFGCELDSLADLVSAGLAPVLLAFQGSLIRIKFWGVLLCFFYLFAGSYRLARFNVLQKCDRSKGYIGLPLPIAGLTLAALWIFRFSTPSPGLWIIPIVFLSFLMVSTIRYDWPKLVFNRHWKNILPTTGILVIVCLMFFFPYWSLLPSLGLYILLGIGNWIVALFKRETTFTELFLSIHK